MWVILSGASDGRSDIKWNQPGTAAIQIDILSAVLSRPNAQGIGLLTNQVVFYLGSRSLTNFTNIRYSFTHGGGVFPFVEDRC
jgi:hypothetical protein